MRLVYAILVQYTVHVQMSEWMILISPSIALLLNREFNHSWECLEVPIREKLDSRNISVNSTSLLNSTPTHGHTLWSVTCMLGCFVMILNSVKWKVGLKLDGHSPGTSHSLELFPYNILIHSEWRPQIFIPKRKWTSIVSSNWQQKCLYFHYKLVKLNVLCRQNKIWTFGNPFHSKKLPICT